MKKFNWIIASKIMSVRHLDWLEKNHEKPIPENQYIIAMQKLREFSDGKRSNGNYSPSKLKKSYEKLKDEFGFFQNAL